MKQKVMSKIKIDEKIRSLPRHEQLFCHLFNKYRWLSLANIHPLTTYRAFENPNQLDLEFELIEIDNYLMNHARNKDMNRVWYKDSWVTGIQKWLKTTKRAQVNPDLFVSIDDMVEKKEEPKEKLQGLEKMYDLAINARWQDKYSQQWEDVKKYIVGDLNKNQLTGIWWSPSGDHIRSRVMKAKSRIDHESEFCGWIYQQKDLPTIVGTYIIGIWAGEYDVDILDEDYPPKKKEEQTQIPESEIKTVDSHIPEDLRKYNSENIMTITELKEKLINRMKV
jgi:hypothetical protein